MEFSRRDVLNGTVVALGAAVVAGIGEVCGASLPGVPALTSGSGGGVPCAAACVATRTAIAQDAASRVGGIMR